MNTECPSLSLISNDRRNRSNSFRKAKNQNIQSKGRSVNLHVSIPLALSNFYQNDLIYPKPLNDFPCKSPELSFSPLPKVQRSQKSKKSYFQNSKHQNFISAPESPQIELKILSVNFENDENLSGNSNVEDFSRPIDSSQLSTLSYMSLSALSSGYLSQKECIDLSKPRINLYSSKKKRYILETLLKFLNRHRWSIAVLLWVLVFTTKRQALKKLNLIRKW